MANVPDVALSIGVKNVADKGLRGLEGSFKKASGGIKGALKSIAGAAFGPAGAIAAVAGLAYAGKKVLGDFLERGDALSKMSIRTGVAVESLSEMDYVLRQNDATLEDYQRGLTRLARNVANPTEKFVESLDAMGLSVQDLEGQSLDEMFLRWSDGMAGLEHPAAIAAHGFETVGRVSEKLIPTALLTSDGIAALGAEARATGHVLSQEAADASAKFNDQLDHLKNTVAGVVTGGLNLLLPTLVRFGDYLVDTVIPGVKSLAAALGERLGTALTALTPAFDAIKVAAGKAWDGIAAAAVWVWEEAIRPAASGVADWLATTIWPAITSAAQWAWDGISTAAEFAWRRIQPAASGVADWLATTIWPAIKSGAEAAWDGIAAAAVWVWDNAIKPGATGVAAFLKDKVWPRVKQDAQTVWGFLGDAASATWESIKDLSREVWDAIGDDVEAAWTDHIKPTLAEFGEYISEDLREDVNALTGTLQDGLIVAMQEVGVQSGQFAGDYSKALSDMHAASLYAHEAIRGDMADTNAAMETQAESGRTLQEAIRIAWSAMVATVFGSGSSMAIAWAGMGELMVNLGVVAIHLWRGDWWKAFKGMLKTAVDFADATIDLVTSLGRTLLTVVGTLIGVDLLEKWKQGWTAIKQATIESLNAISRFVVNATNNWIELINKVIRLGNRVASLIPGVSGYPEIPDVGTPQLDVPADYVHPAAAAAAAKAAALAAVAGGGHPLGTDPLVPPAGSRHGSLLPDPAGSGGTRHGNLLPEPATTTRHGSLFASSSTTAVLPSLVPSVASATINVDLRDSRIYGVNDLDDRIVAAVSVAQRRGELQ